MQSRYCIWFLFFFLFQLVSFTPWDKEAQLLINTLFSMAMAGVVVFFKPPSVTMDDVIKLKGRQRFRALLSIALPWVE